MEDKDHATETATGVENPPAFPMMDMNCHEGIDRLELRHEGMSLRDYFAAKAIQGMMSDKFVNTFQTAEDVDRINAVVVCAYTVADAMLIARKK